MDVFTQLAVILGLAAVCGVGARLLRQPPLVGYVFSGMILSLTGGYLFNSIEDVVVLMGKLGVTLLLFLTGLELPLTELRKMGKVAMLTATGQIVTTSMVGFAVASLLGFERMTAIYIGVGMTFGSTIMVVKLLSEMGNLQSLPGKIAVGYLLVQDFVAVGLLVVMSGMATGNIQPIDLVLVLIKGVVMVGVAVALSGKLMSKVVDRLAKSTELLFIASIGWCLGIAALVSSPMVGFSVEIGGLLAGLALANVAEQTQIMAKVRPLRDFFLTWFFVYLGASFHWGNVAVLLVPALFFSFFVLVGNPLIIMAILGFLGYGKRTYFMASISVAQISEFSLIILANAAALGQIDKNVVSMMTIVALLTMTGSTYMILHSHKLFELFKGKIGFFERRGLKKDKIDKGKKYANHGILFGHNRVGSRIRPALEKALSDVLVVDFNPEIIEKLRDKGVEAIYGDMSDRELYEAIGADMASVVISTVPDISDNIHLLKGISEMRRNNLQKNGQLLVVTANDKFDADRLYALGADYVLVPHSLSGDFLNHMIDHLGVGNELKSYLERKRLSHKKEFGLL
jgi:Kef-type K+ transport system membrane component KefB